MFEKKTPVCQDGDSQNKAQTNAILLQNASLDNHSIASNEVPFHGDDSSNQRTGSWMVASSSRQAEPTAEERQNPHATSGGNSMCNEHMEAIFEGFRRHLEAAGLGAPDLFPDGTLRRHHVPGDKPGKQSGWSVLFGGRIPHGVAGSWKTEQKVRWSSKPSGEMSREERSEHYRQMRIACKQAQIARMEHQAEMAEYAAQCLAAAVPIQDGVTHPYLLRKGISAPDHALVDQAGRMVLAVHHIGTDALQTIQFIDAEGQKRFLPGGKKVEGCIPIQGDRFQAKIIVLTEGVATGCTVAQAVGERKDVAVVAGLDTGNLPRVAGILRAMKPEVKILIAADNDHETARANPPVGNQGIKAARQASTVARGDFVSPPDLPGVSDFNDLANVQGLGAVQALILKALPATGENPAETAETVAPDDNAETAITPNGGATAPVVIVSARENWTVNDAVMYLQRVEGLYNRGNALARVLQGEDGPFIAEAKPLWVRDKLSEHVQFARQKWTREGEQVVHCLVPEWVPGMILERRGDWPGVPKLTAIVETPILIELGRVLHSPGYDPASGVLLFGRAQTSDIPIRPTRREAEVARDLLFDIVCDFTWAKEPHWETHRAAWLSYVLTIVARFVIDGPVPFFLLEASLPGSGKGLLEDVSSFITLRRITSRSQASSDAEEFRKTILSILMRGSRLVFLDEIGLRFGNKFFNNLVTAYPHYSDRVLGQNSMSTLPALAVWAGAGNNVTLAPDLLRRTIPIRLEPEMERPEDRTGFRYPDLLGHVKENQERLLAAALTILLAYENEGSPCSRTVPLGSFESWSRVVRNAVIWITGFDPVSTQKGMAVLLDEGILSTHSLIRFAFDAFGSAWFTAKEFFEKAGKDPKVMTDLEALRSVRSSKEPISVQAVGRILVRCRGVVVEGVKLEAKAEGKHTSFRVLRISGEPDEPSVSAGSAVSVASPGEMAPRKEESSALPTDKASSGPIAVSPLVSDDSSRRKSIEVGETRLTIEYVDSVTRLEQISACLPVDEPLAIDLETARHPEWKEHQKAGLDPHLSKLRLLSLYCGQDTVWVIDLFKVPIGKLGFLSERRCVAHNATFDVKHLLFHGVRLQDVSCTLLMAKLLAENKLGLKDLAAKMMGIDLSKEMQVSDWGSEVLSDEQVRYAALDAVVAYRLYVQMKARLDQRGLGAIHELERRAIVPVARMELSGVNFDRNGHQELIRVFEKRAVELESELRQRMGGVLLTSAKQVSGWLKENLPSSCTSGWPITGSGQLRTDRETLQQYISKAPICGLLLDYREAEKMVSTYGDKFAEHINPVSKRIHSSFRIADAGTGRFTCSSPNVQNIPRSYGFRALFRPEEGNVFVVADYSQIELRVGAHVAEDEGMLLAYRQGEDLHRKTAASLLHCTPAEVTKEQRQQAKSVNFGMLFGQSAGGLVQYAKSAYGVTLTLAEAEIAREGFYQTYPKIRQWQNRVVAEARQRGFVLTPTGRQRTVEPGAYSEAMNTPIQGGAAEVLLSALAHLEEDLLRDCPAVRLVNIVHDEVLLECPLADGDSAKDKLQAAMEKGMTDIFPDASLTGLVDIKVVQNWGEK